MRPERGPTTAAVQHGQNFPFVESSPVSFRGRPTAGSSSICLLVFDSDYRLVVDDNGTITTFDMLLCHLLIVGLPAESHLIFICSALDYGG
jgi:hypothetical protein